jgi:hypothetical protein
MYFIHGVAGPLGLKLPSVDLGKSKIHILMQASIEYACDPKVVRLVPKVVRLVPKVGRLVPKVGRLVPKELELEQHVCTFMCMYEFIQVLQTSGKDKQKIKFK